MDPSRKVLLWKELLFNTALRYPRRAEEGFYLPLGQAGKVPGGLSVTRPDGLGPQPEGGLGAPLPPASGLCASHPLVTVQQIRGWRRRCGSPHKPGLRTLRPLHPLGVLAICHQVVGGVGTGAGEARLEARVAIFLYPACLSLPEACRSLNWVPQGSRKLEDRASFWGWCFWGK